MELFSNSQGSLVTNIPSSNANFSKSNNLLLENNVKFKNQHLSSLLSAVLGPSLDNNSKQSLQISTGNKKAKRGRKVLNKNSAESDAANKESDSEPQLKKSTKIRKSVSSSLINESERNKKNR